ncbi:iron ABC transporter [Desulfuribacillus stibiiarsenatis]|uniref:Iron ABC transporter n=1 Tax=Desulfuribacillus stibiiarsenatis TaxID=1390249 RepID=A0A1E5L7K5_9FIRM|nr:iron ABC transporter permease [Desulfuribacillus stibiiarsenatis]OEH86137.1 iron ABC transporter [Desulfuribacillus stibiiarsenatis]
MIALRKLNLWKRLRHHLNIWAVLSLISIIIIIVPSLLIAIEFFAEPNHNWTHIKEYLLQEYIYNSIVLLLFTALATIVIGVSLAWLVTMYKFPLRNILKWGLILPLAIPPYIGAYTYHGIFNYTGIVQVNLRNTFEITVNQSYFNIMTIPGAIFIFTIFLYPYVYTITRSFYQFQSSSLIENARLLGSNSIETFFRIGLPISRVAIVGSVTLVVLEVLNDYGVASYFGIQTFSTAIFRTWYGMQDIDSALKLAGALMLIVILILILEKFLRGRKRYSFSSTKVRPIQPQQLKGWKAFLVFFYCFGVFVIACIIPILQLLQWAYITYEKIYSNEFINLIYQSILVASIASSIIVLGSLVIANYTRLYRGALTKIISRVTTLGYSIPGAAIAIAVITVFLAIDRYLTSISDILSVDPIFVFRTSLVMLIVAYIIRFLAIGYNSIESGFEKVGNTFTEASRMLGYSTVKTFFKIDIPLVRGAIFSGFILVFVDILKELPLTLFLQPFNFATLATQAFKYANDEMVHEAALASLLIIFISGISIYFFHRILDKEPR